MDKTKEQAPIPLFVATGKDAPREGLPFIERNSITAIVRDPKANKFIGLKWKEVDWETFITGGIEDGQTAEDAARAEIQEETGFRNLRLVAELPPYDSKFYHKPKGENRFAHFRSFLFELVDDEHDELSETELNKHECVWLDEEDFMNFHLPAGQRFIFESINNKG